jgi:ribonuclease D
MDVDPELWLRRPLDQASLHYAAADVAQLHALHAHLAALLGRSGVAGVMALSAANAEYFWDVGDRGCSAAADSYRCARQSVSLRSQPAMRHALAARLWCCWHESGAPRAGVGW